MQVQRLRMDDAVSLIRRKADSMPYERVYFALKKMRVKHIIPHTVETMRLCLAIHQVGLRITPALVVALRGGGSETTALDSLHVLGDKKCLTLLTGSKGRCLEWVVSAEFLQNYGEEVEG